MSDHSQPYPIKRFAATIADCMALPLPQNYAPPIRWVSNLLKRRLGGPADRVVLYHADAVTHGIWRQYTDLFAPVYAHTSLAIPMRSTIPSIAPAVYASMYTGLDPMEHGVQSFVHPPLTCDTLFDQFIRAGKRAAVVNMTDSPLDHIFAGRVPDCFSAPHPAGILEKTLNLISDGGYDVISIRTAAYDAAAQAYGSESKEGFNAISMEAEVFSNIAGALKAAAQGRRTLLAYVPGRGSAQIEDVDTVHFYGTI